ncbi:hypothetical protein QA646_27205 (plasmid) [Rhizobium sp. CB3090]|uniref:hypothetical protein n=1 Tax=Rhizobium sp. CB3090 TaxID=3039156 RepID=UPI0024B1C032|nr:hypothetical protein [Rhizobium sp. CB3090]WFU13047.1 hypothetical protein QA646_27205 [Rhizobium sp. CB3090]
MKYSAKADVNGGWSVVDALTQDVAEILGWPLIGVGKELAQDTADLLNLEESKNKPELED